MVVLPALAAALLCLAHCVAGVDDLYAYNWDGGMRGLPEPVAPGRPGAAWTWSYKAPTRPPMEKPTREPALPSPDNWQQCYDPGEMLVKVLFNMLGPDNFIDLLNRVERRLSRRPGMRGSDDATSSPPAPAVPPMQAQRWHRLFAFPNPFDSSTLDSLNRLSDAIAEESRRLANEHLTNGLNKLTDKIRGK